MTGWRDRYGPVLGAFHLGMLAMAMHYGMAIWREGSPITPELYGPAAYYIPAIWWAAAQMTGAGMAAAGSVWRHRAGPLIMAAGGALSAAVYLVFIVMARQAEQGTLVQSAGICVALPFSIGTMLAGLGARHGRQR